jgi:hypothetical protein
MGGVPPGTLALDVFTSPGTTRVGGCALDVGAAITGGDCLVELPQVGTYAVRVTYTGASTRVAPSTQTTMETISAYSTTTTITSTTDGSITSYSASVVDGPSAAPLSYQIVDSTTGQTVGTVSYVLPGIGISFYVATAADNGGGYPAIFSDEGEVSAQINPSDSFTIAAAYNAPPGAAWLGSSSQAIPLQFSPQ